MSKAIELAEQIEINRQLSAEVTRLEAECASLCSKVKVIAAAKQEECAKVCDEHPGNIRSSRWTTQSALANCAAANRA